LEEELESGRYPKIRELDKMLRPILSPPKIMAVLSYLQRSNKIEVDLDGNIIWTKRDHRRVGTIYDSAIISDDLRKLIRDYSGK
jgi:hypothetical protein